MMQILVPLSTLAQLEHVPDRVAQLEKSLNATRDQLAALQCRYSEVLTKLSDIMRYL